MQGLELDLIQSNLYEFLHFVQLYIFFNDIFLAFINLTEFFTTKRFSKLLAIHPVTEKIYFYLIHFDYFQCLFVMLCEFLPILNKHIQAV